jgi:Bacterial regulatory protein, Fis family/Histidine kinase-, DNA gyrase B-, and HSP90-like ATPase
MKCVRLALYNEYRKITLDNCQWIGLRQFAGEMSDRIGIGLEGCPDFDIYTDELYMALLIENLFRNSLQAGAAGVSIKTDGPDQKGPFTELLYEDNGSGYPEECDISELISPFTTYRSRGTGLGLYLVQKIALAHGGAISLYRLNKGAGVRFSLPRNRINGITFGLPPLRERKEDIRLLVSTFIDEANRAYNKNVSGVSPKVMRQFADYCWPGNIRQLKWLIHHAVAVTSRDLLDADDLSASSDIFKDGPKAGGLDYSVPFQEALKDLEKSYIGHALLSADNNRTEAARILGISVRVLHYKIRKYGL